eukprot:SAG31_NODE_19074_length_613_cov_0.500000_1_plen_36_part_10
MQSCVDLHDVSALYQNPLAFKLRTMRWLLVLAACFR